MRYTVGITIIDKKTKFESSGYYATGPYGFPVILNENNIKDVLKKDELSKYSLYVFDNPEDAEFFCRCLSHSYRRDDVWGNKRLKSKRIRRFYPLKVDSSKFCFKFGDEKSTSQLEKDCFGNKLDKKRTLTRFKILEYIR